MLISRPYKPTANVESLIASAASAAIASCSEDGEVLRAQVAGACVASRAARVKVAADRKVLMAELAEASRPSFFARALGVVGRAAAAILLPAVGVIETARLAAAARSGALEQAMIGSGPLGSGAWHVAYVVAGAVMAPAVGLLGVTGLRVEGSVRAARAAEAEANASLSSVDRDRAQSRLAASVEGWGRALESKRGIESGAQAIREELDRTASRLARRG